jgi:hypothetical protein
MGRKGVSKHKAKKIKPVSSENPTGRVNSPVQSLVNKKTTPHISNVVADMPAKIKGKGKKGQ